MVGQPPVRSDGKGCEFCVCRLGGEVQIAVRNLDSGVAVILRSPA